MALSTCILEVIYVVLPLNILIIIYLLKVREGRKPEKASDAENFEANIAEVLLMVQVSCLNFYLKFLGSLFKAHPFGFDNVFSYFWNLQGYGE